MFRKTLITHLSLIKTHKRPFLTKIISEERKTQIIRESKDFYIGTCLCL
jgi:hypothetical protein